MSVTFSAARPGVVLGYAASCYRYGEAQQFRGAVCATADAAGLAHAHDHPAVPAAVVQDLSVEELVASGDRLVEIRALLDAVYDCDFDGYVVAVRDTDADPIVQLSNANAAVVLDRLGVTGDGVYCGSMPAVDFVNAVNAALVLTSVLPREAATPAREVVGPGATVVDCGRPDGYFADKLAQLLAVGEFASRHGVAVTWG